MSTKQREIKFRAFCKDTEHMFTQGTDFGFEFGGGDNAIRVYSSDGEIDIIQNTDLVFMQYTNLKDKNGKEIYEGDIFIGKHRKTREEYSRVVTFKNAGFVLLPNHSYMHDCVMVGEVIGNIYENPELLEANHE